MKLMDMMVKNTWGKPDAMLTLSALTVIVVLLKLLVNGLSISVAGSTVITFGTLDGTVVGALLTPTLGAYVAHRYTEHKFIADVTESNKVEPEPKKEG